jgi:xylulokinase
MEGATLGLAYGLRRFAELGLAASEIRLTGGGSKSSVWRQMSADVFGVPVVGLATAEGAGLGAAIQAAHANGQGSYEALCEKYVALDESTRAKPDLEAAAMYRDKLDHQMALTNHLAAGGYL